MKPREKRWRKKKNKRLKDVTNEEKFSIPRPWAFALSPLPPVKLHIDGSMLPTISLHLF